MRTTGLVKVVMTKFLTAEAVLARHAVATTVAHDRMSRSWRQRERQTHTHESVGMRRPRGDQRRALSWISGGLRAQGAGLIRR